MTQGQALAILKTGTNVFLTGEPGSGKTHTVNQYVQYLRQHGIGVAVTASTGIAATHLGGITIHSWSGVGVRKVLTDKDLTALRDNKRLVSRAQKTSVLIIDEISMLEAKVLTAIDQALQALCSSSESFGGLQVVFVGDFFQLPPVSQGIEQVQFAHDSLSWSQARPVVCYLTEQHRQSDTRFSTFLNAIRSGVLPQDELAFLHTRKVEVKLEQVSTRLYSHNVDVDNLNTQKLQALHSKEYVFEMTSRGRKPLVEQLQKGCLSPEKLVLKTGAHVMFTKNNYEAGYVNGTLGKVIGFNKDGLPVVLTKDGFKLDVEPVEWQIEEHGRVLASISQIPLRLAWAITVHKSQGMTLDEAVVDLSRAFEFGQGYVAISRVRSSKGLYVSGFNHKALLVHPEIIQADVNFRSLSHKAEVALNHYSESQIMAKHKAFIVKNGGKIKANKKSQATTYDQTLELYKSGLGLAEIAKERGFTPQTIVGHLEKLRQKNKLTKQDLLPIIPANLSKALPRIHQAFAQMGDEKLSPVFHKFKGKYSYEDLKLARLVRD